MTKTLQEVRYGTYWRTWGLLLAFTMLMLATGYVSLPKAFVVLAAHCSPDADTARAILRHVRERVSPYKRIRRLEFAALPKTISGKIRRVELRKLEHARDATRRSQEFWEEDLR